MKRAWAAAAIPLAWAGCKWQPAPAPPPAACRVDLSRLVRADPRWRHAQAMDARYPRPRPGVAEPAARARPAPLPDRLPPPQAPPAPAPRDLPPSVGAMAKMGEEAARARREQLEPRQEARVAADRLEREGLDALFDRVQRSETLDDLVRVEQEAYRRYQAEITSLRLRRPRLEVRSPVPDVRKRQAEELAALEEWLMVLVGKRDAEKAGAQAKIRQELAAELTRRKATSARANKALEDELRKQCDLAVRTLEQEWQERVDSATEALREPPPGPAAEPPIGALAPPGTKGTARIVPAPPAAAPVAPSAASRRARRARLERLLLEETRRRVLAVGRQHNLRPLFGAGDRELPDRTEFFARQLGRM